MLASPMFHDDSIHQSVMNVLNDCMSSDMNIRMKGELHLKELFDIEVVSKILITLALNQTIDLPKRQLAAVTLKNYIETHWTSKSEKFIGPEPSEEAKRFVRSHLLNGLGDTSPKIRINIAYIISRIAHTDWPETWPDFFDALMSFLKSDNINQVHGAMRVLSEFVRDDITDQQFPLIAPILVPELYRILCSPQIYPGKVRARGIIIFRDFLEMLQMVKSEHPAAIKNYLEPWLGGWLDVFQKILGTTTHSVSDGAPLRKEILETLIVLVKHFPKHMKPYNGLFLELNWRNFSQLAAKYCSQIDQEDGPVNEQDTRLDFDGETVNDDKLLDQFMQFFRAVASSKRFGSIFLVTNDFTPTPFFIELVQTLIQLMQIPAHLCETWLNDIEQFLDDEESHFSYSVRVAANELLTDLVENYNVVALKGLINTLPSNLGVSDGSSSWKIHEATLYALGAVSEMLVESMGHHNLAFDLKGLCNQVLLRDMQNSAFPLLQGRALYVTSQLSSKISNVDIFVQVAIEALKQNENNLLWVFALKSLQQFHTAGHSLDHVQAMIIERSGALLNEFEERCLELVLETMVMTVKMNPDTTLQYAEPLTQLVLQIWSTHKDDSVVTSIVTDLVQGMTKYSAVLNILEQGLLPTIVQLLNQGSDQHSVSVLSYTLELLIVLSSAHADSLPSYYVETIFPYLMKELCRTENIPIIQYGQELLKTMVSKSFDALQSWSDGNNQTGLFCIISFIGKCLQPDQDESSAVFVGEVIVKLILKGSDTLGSVLPDLLRACIYKLDQAKRPTLIQSLVLVFAHLIRSDEWIDQVLFFLNQTVLSCGRSGLQVLVRCWCENFIYFSGFYDLKVSVFALVRLYEKHDPVLDHVLVKGDLICNSASSRRIVTRSRARAEPEKFTEIGFPVKVIKLLLAEYMQHLESRMLSGSSKLHSRNAGEAGNLNVGNGGHAADDEFNDEDEDWEDEEDDVSTHLEHNLFESRLSLGEELENSNEDSDIRQDELYKLDIKDFVAQFFKKEANNAGFQSIYNQSLSPYEQEQMRMVFQL